MNNSVEQELWRVFTFYSLHGDANQPELLRPANFLRFCKDCQITSKKLTPTAIELEITRLIRSKEITNDYSSTLTINFVDFLQLLDSLAQKVYAKESAEVAIKRLLLENVLLLASRRPPMSDSFDFSDVEANRVIREVYGRCLQRIFDYYLDRADKRRNQAVSAEKVGQRDIRGATAKDLSSSYVTGKAQQLQQLKEQARAQKSLIGYREYIQFCYDFNLKSTSLLTAIQVGEIFLNIVLISTEGKGGDCLGMSFENFLRSIMYMAFIAYRDAHSSVTVANKVKALLLYMWKAVNDNQKTRSLVTNNRNNTLSHFAGALNVFGSGMFSDLFLGNWMKDGFPDYSAGTDNDRGNKSGSMMLKSVVHMETEENGTGGNFESGDSSPFHKTRSASNQGQTGVDELNDKLDRSLTLSPPPRRTNSIYVTPFMATVKARAATNVDVTDANSGLFGGPEETCIIQGIVDLEGEKLVALTRARPELAEYLALEIQNMKLRRATEN
jgi:hypothetical protein